MAKFEIAAVDPIIQDGRRKVTRLEDLKPTIGFRCDYCGDEFASDENVGVVAWRRAIDAGWTVKSDGKDGLHHACRRVTCQLGKKTLRKANVQEG